MPSQSLDFPEQSGRIATAFGIGKRVRGYVEMERLALKKSSPKDMFIDLREEREREINVRNINWLPLAHTGPGTEPTT